MGLIWVCIYSSQFMHKVEIIQALLEEENINSVIYNKQDSSYHIGEIELHVHPDDVLKAKQIVTDNES